MDDRELEWLRRHRELCRRLAADPQPGSLLSDILDAAIELTDAERGFLVLCGRNPETGRVRLKVEEARGFDKAKLLAGGGKVSRTVVMRVLDEDRAVLTTSELDADIPDVTSVKNRRVRSIVAVPIRLRGSTRGVVYLDHRFDPAAFTAEDLPVLEAFADHTAVALETAALIEDQSDGRERLRAAQRELEELRRERAERKELGERSLSTLPIPRFGALVGDAPAMLEVYERVDQASRSDAPVLITGEVGCGKGVAAREIHERSARAAEPFREVSCASLGVAELAALLREAGAGTAVLNEIDELPPALQQDLLRTLQDRFVRAGAAEPTSLRCRVAATTRVDLAARVSEGGFREDLFYRLDVLRIAVPPLRERTEDVGPLLLEFTAGAGVPLRVEPDVMERLHAYPWPGNVRELQNEAVRLRACPDRVVTVGDLSPEVQRGVGAPTDDDYAGKTLQEVERAMLVRALEQAGGNKSQTARLLGVPRSTLYDLLQRHGL